MPKKIVECGPLDECDQKPDIPLETPKRIILRSSNIDSTFNNIQKKETLSKNFNPMFSKDAEIQKLNVFMTNENKNGDFLKESVQKFEENDEKLCNSKNNINYQVLALSEIENQNLTGLIYDKIQKIREIKGDNEIFDYFFENKHRIKDRVLDMLDDLGIKKNTLNLKQGINCLIVIGFALLKSDSFIRLQKDIVDYTGKSKQTTQKIIHRYIKSLGDKKSNINANQWLPLERYYYTNEEVLYWIQLFKQYGNREEVLRILESENKPVPSLGTLTQKIIASIGSEEYTKLLNKKGKGAPRKSYDEMIELAKRMGIEKTGKEGFFKTSKADYNTSLYPDATKFKWECGACGEKFERSPNSVKQGHWCELCARRKNILAMIEPYENIQELAKRIGSIKTGVPGRFVPSKEQYYNTKDPSHAKSEWYCEKCNSSFDSTITRIKRPQWCPLCTQGESERICRGYFERIFNSKFPKGKPKWLKNPETGGQLIFDGYNEYLGIAFEFNGPQHYKFYPKYHRNYQDFLYQQYLDLIKSELSKKNGVIIITIPYTLDYDEFQAFIIHEYEKLTGNIISNLEQYDWRLFNLEQ